MPVKMTIFSKIRLNDTVQTCFSSNGHRALTWLVRLRVLFLFFIHIQSRGRSSLPALSVEMRNTNSATPYSVGASASASK